MTSPGNEPYEGEQGKLAPIERLDADSMHAILKMADIESLVDLIKASPSAFRVMHSSGYYQGVCRALLLRELGPSLPLAIARLDAATAKWRRKISSEWTEERADKYAVQLGYFCDRHLRGNATKKQGNTNYMTLENTFKLLAFHRVVSDWVGGIALYMVQQPPKSRFRFSTTSSYERQLSEQERYRVARMLYVTEIVSILLPQKRSEGVDREWEEFWGCFAPWDFCQYLEMQVMMFEFYQIFDLTWRGMPRKVVSGVYRPETHGTKYLKEILVLQACLKVMMPMVKRYLNPSSARTSPQILDFLEDIIDHPEVPNQWEYRYIMQRKNVSIGLYRIFEEYKNIWLQQMRIPGTDFVAYSLDTTQIEERYPLSDEGPLACWLYDMLRYGERHKARKFRLRDSSKFFMTSFWDRARWDTVIRSGMPSMARLKKDAQSYCLTDRSMVVRIPSPDETPS
ncbi:hypothetical protein GGR52DRAFT_573111 [Hypoxylon sp. FL1284]|nr:hypothetical protein GGR52DRAFT_573111 [Hypoxylon sp. FL1284]